MRKRRDHRFFWLLSLNNFYLVLAVLGLRCCMQAFSSCGKQGQLFVAVYRLLAEVASVVMEHRLSCSTACGIFPDQGLSP